MTDYSSILNSPQETVLVDGEKILTLQHMLIPPHLDIFIRSPKNAGHLQSVLMREYPADHTLEIILSHGEAEYQTIQVSLSELNEKEAILGQAVALHVPPLNENQSFEYFQNVVAVLRAPGGCPWDMKQTHQSLRDDFLQEVYELLEGLDRNNLAAVMEELGDVLLHLVMQAQIAQEQQEFKMSDVVQHISEKLIYRHEHVFGKVESLTPDEVISRWERMKKLEREKEDKDQGLLDGISKAMPALSMAYSYQKRAARVGFDWDSIDGVREKLNEEIEEFKIASTPEEQAEEMGDIFFSLVNLARWWKIDPETALRTANLKFYDRVHYVEMKAKALGKNLFDMPMSEKDQYWDEYKAS